MRQIRNRKLLALILCAALLVALCGCQEKGLVGVLPLDSESIVSLESLYGKGLGTVIKKLEIPKEDVIEMPTGARCWYSKNPIAIDGRDFDWVLDFTSSTNQFCGIWYTCHCDGAEETADLAETFYLDIVEEFGGPGNQYFVGPDPLSSEGAFDAMRSAEQGDWIDAWIVSDISYLVMSVSVREDKPCSIQLKCWVLPEEWHRFEPGAQAHHAIGPMLRGDNG